MPDADLFSRLGLFVIKDFFNPELCSKVRAEMSLATGTPGSVWMKESSGDVQNDALKRRTEMSDIPQTTMSLAKDRLLALMPLLEKHFKIRLNGCQGTKFVVYREGDFYGPHLDISDDPEAPQYAKERRAGVGRLLNRVAVVTIPRFFFRGGRIPFFFLYIFFRGVFFFLPPML